MVELKVSCTTGSEFLVPVEEFLGNIRGAVLTVPGVLRHLHVEIEYITCTEGRTSGVRALKLMHAVPDRLSKFFLLTTATFVSVHPFHVMKTTPPNGFGDCGGRVQDPGAWGGSDDAVNEATTPLKSMFYVDAIVDDGDKAVLSRRL